MPITPKYFYVEDDTAVLFAANGTALAGLLVGISDVAPSLNLPAFPTYPMWLYLVGLVFAFCAKAIIQLSNGDIRQREKLQHGRDFIIEALEHPELTPELKAQLTAGWKTMEEHYSRLLKPHHGPRLDKWRAVFFFSSALCFLVSTSSLIHLAVYIKTAIK